jgi:hypothetical protein
MINGFTITKRAKTHLRAFGILKIILDDTLRPMVRMEDGKAKGEVKGRGYISPCTLAYSTATKIVMTMCISDAVSRKPNIENDQNILLSARRQS